MLRYEYDDLDRLVQAERGAEGGSWSTAAGGQKWALDMLGNWDSAGNDFNGDGDGDYEDTGEEVARDHNFANEIEEIGGVLPFAYDAAGNMTEQGLPAAATKKYTHDAWNRLVRVRIDEAVLGEYEYNALHWRTVKRLRSPGAGSLDEMRLMYYSANWQLFGKGRVRHPLVRLHRRRRSSLASAMSSAAASSRRCGAIGGPVSARDSWWSMSGVRFAVDGGAVADCSWDDSGSPPPSELGHSSSQISWR